MQQTIGSHEFQVQYHPCSNVKMYQQMHVACGFWVCKNLNIFGSILCGKKKGGELREREQILEKNLY